MRGKKCRFPNSSIQLLSLFSLYVVSSSLQPHGAHEAPLSMGFPWQEYWSGLPFPSPGNLPNPRIKPMFLLDRWILYHWATWEAPFTQSWHYFVIWGLRVTPFIFFFNSQKVCKLWSCQSRMRLLTWTYLYITSGYLSSIAWAGATTFRWYWIVAQPFSCLFTSSTRGGTPAPTMPVSPTSLHCEQERDGQY